MKRIAAPMVGGIFTSFILELLVYPAIYEVWRWNTVVKKQITPEGAEEDLQLDALAAAPVLQMNVGSSIAGGLQDLPSS
jgi:hypothetical protein